MIRSFKGKFAEAMFAGEHPRGFPANLVKVSRRKLEAVNAAEKLTDLGTPPGNRLEALSGDRKGQHSIRINEQWRVCFRWDGNDAHNVEVVDYH